MTAGEQDPRFEARLEIAEVAELAEDVKSLLLRDPTGEPLPAWAPGAHVDIHLSTGLERQYSLCGTPSESDVWRVAVLRERPGRGGSAYIHDKVAAGDRLTVRGPRNNFRLFEAEDYRFIAGGIGITPLLPMVEYLTGVGAPWRLLYGGRRRSSMAFVDRLRATGGDISIRPEDEFGLLDLDRFLADMSDGTKVYVCGPEPLIQAVEAMSGDWPGDVLRLERFHPRDGALEGSADGFTLVLDRSGVTVDVAPGQTIVDALASVGVDADTSCLEGTCGTCETRVIDGIPDHRDSILTPAEKASNTMMMICCSRSQSDRLVLDL